MKSTGFGAHPEARAKRARAAFRAEYGETAAEERAAEIAALSRADWKERKGLYVIRCHGTRGKGPHDMKVEEALLWSVLTIRAFICPWHT